MLPDTLPCYVFIRLAIWALRAVAPASVACCLARALGYVLVPWPVEVLACAEALFYLCVGLPMQRSLDRSQPAPVPRSRREREALFERCWANVPDLASVLRVWFQGAPLDRIRRDDLKDFLAWAFLGQARARPADDDELDDYVRRIEDALGRPFPPGRGPVQAMRVSTDPLPLQHKPLVFYVLAIGVDDLVTYAKARRSGLVHYRLPLRAFWTVFPFRPHTLCGKHTSPSGQLAYWYRPHTSRTRLPVLFIHGIGVGMRTYTGFLRDFVRADPADDGQTGLLALELMPISMRITRGMPSRLEMLAEILRILDHHGWHRFVVAGHSFGTIVATHLLHHLAGTGRVGPLLLADPVALSIHWGGVPYHFLYRRPRKASEWQLHYFVSTELCVTQSITRRFDWAENVLWKDDMRGRDLTITLASDDIITEPFALREYLLGDRTLRVRWRSARDGADGAEDEAGAGGGIEILWYDGLNHSEVFETAAAWRPLVAVLHGYCGKGR